MKKTVYLTLLTILTIVCIVAGLCYHVVGGTIGKLFGISGAVKTSSGADVDDTEVLGAFDVIRLDIAAAEVVIENGSDFAVAYSGNEDYRPQYAVEDGVLTLKSGSKKINIGISVKSEITITVPEDAKLSLIDVSVDAGNLEIHDTGAASLSVDVDAGNVEVYDAMYGTVSADVDAGNLTFDNCELTDTKLETAMGNIELKSCTFDTVDAGAEMGNVKLHSSRSLEDYEMDLETNLGNITVNGRDYSGGYYSDGNTGKWVKISVNMGNAELTY